MTDKELLYGAAKALGLIGVVKIDMAGVKYFLVTGDLVEGCQNIYQWLDNDADAFRLAVDLGISVQQGLSQVAVSHITLALEGVFIKEDCLDQGAWTSTRRAITRAAAAIGEQK